MKYDSIKSLPKGLVEDVAKFLKREPIDVVEEAEQLDELDKKTLGSYIKKAVDQVPAYKAGADSLEKAAGEYRSKELSDTAQKLRVKQFNRSVGIKKAADKLSEDVDLEDLLFVDEDFNIGVVVGLTEDVAEVMFGDEIVNLDTAAVVFEEVEQLDEVSKETLKGYYKKAKADPAFDKKKGKPSKVTVAIRAKREKGIASAKEKLQSILKAESEAAQAHAKKLNAKLDAHFESEAPKILKKHGYEPIHTGVNENRYANEQNKVTHLTTYVKKHDNGHVTMITMHKKPLSHFGSSAHEAKAVSSRGSSFSGHGAHYGVYDQAGHDAHMTDMMPKFEQHVMNVKAHGDADGSW